MKKNKILVFILVIVFALAFLLRFRFFLGGDFLLLLDQSRDLLLASDIVSTHKIPLIGARSGLGGVFHGPLWIFMIMPLFLITNGNPFLTLVPLFLLVSMAIVLIGFFIGKNLYGLKFGIIFSFFLATSSSLVNIVPYTTNAQVMPFVYLLFLFTIFKFLRGNDKFLVWSVFLIGIGIHFEVAFAVMLFPLTILALVLRWKMPSIKFFILSLGAFILSISTYILFELRHHFLMTTSVLKLLSGKVGPGKGYEKYLNLQFRIEDRAVNLKNSFLDSFYVPNYWLFILMTAIILLALFIFVREVRKKKMDKEWLFLLLTPIIIFSLYVFYNQPLWAHYILPISISSIFFFALSLEKIFAFKIGKGLALLFIAIISLFSFSNVYSSYSNMKPYYSNSDGSYKNQKGVVDWVFKDAGNKKFGYFVYNPQVLTYNMDYLFNWIGKSKTESKFSNKKEKINYLIMYSPPVGDLSAHDFWKKNVVRTNGKVIESRSFKGDIVVQKIETGNNEGVVDPNYYQGILFR